MEVYVVESHNNGMVWQLFRSNKILVAVAVATVMLSDVKLVNIKPHNSGNFFEKVYLPVTRSPPRTKVIKWTTAHLPKVRVSFGKTWSRREKKC